MNRSSARLKFRRRIQQGRDPDQLLVEAFAVCREASSGALGAAPFRCPDDRWHGAALRQDRRKCAPARVNAGGNPPVYLNALAGKGVHVVTGQRLPARRDAEWMAYACTTSFGVPVGINLSQMDHDTKQAAYAADITYGTNNEFGFDYLRDNMVYSAGERVQRPLSFAVVDGGI